MSQSLEARQPLPLPRPSLSTSLAALTSPTASSADLACALTVGRTREGWRSSSVVRQSSWRCTNCSTIVAQSVMACSTCGTTYAELSGQASEAELRAISDDCALTHYGRSLAYTSNVSPLVAEGVGALPGSAEYCAAVQARTVSMMQGRPQEFRVEPKLPKGANLFDGWLALHTGDTPLPARIASRDDVIRFAQRSDIEEIVSQSIYSLSTAVMQLQTVWQKTTIIFSKAILLQKMRWMQSLLHGPKQSQNFPAHQ